MKGAASARDLQRLVEAASAARANAYCPYSEYAVGAAILTRAGSVYTGCNVENATYGATLCAERAAIAAMVGAGDRDPIACAVVTGGPEPGAPCGICRQVLAEFARDMKLVLVAETGASGARGRSTSVTSTRKRTERLAKLLPRAFRLRPLP